MRETLFPELKFKSFRAKGEYGKERPMYLENDYRRNGKKTDTTGRIIILDHERCSDRSIFSRSSRFDWHSTHKHANGNA
jgi:hypothetical protein